MPYSRPAIAALLLALLAGAMAAASRPSMYEISTRPWLYALTQKYGRPITRLADIPDQEFEKLANMGVEMVWMMGVWKLGAYGLNFDRTNPNLLNEYSQVLPGYTTADIIGSPYAPVEYSCNPELGSDADIATLRTRLNKLGMKLMLDFVPNHTAYDCPWVTSNIDYYVRAPRGTNPPYNSNDYFPDGVAYGGHDWKDTAQLNYWNTALWQPRIAEIMKIASLADAIRCDMAMLLLNDQIQGSWGANLASWGYSRPSQEFWQVAIAQVKAKYPNVVFLAEAYSQTEGTLQSLGFDFTYDKYLYDLLTDGNLENIRAYLKRVERPYFYKTAHFVGNHDEAPAIANFGSWWRADAAALVSMTLPGMRFYWYRDVEGLQYRLDVHLRRGRTENAQSQVPQFYDKLMNITSAPVFRTGQWTYLDVSGANDSWRLMAWRWEQGNEKRLCVVNYSDAQGSGKVVVSNAVPVNGNDNIPVTELFSGTVYIRSASDMANNGLFVIVAPWSAQIFEYN